MIRRLRRGSTAVSAITVATAAVVLVGWVFNIATLKSVLPGLATMKVNTALSLLACGCALWIKTRSPRKSIWSKIADGLACITVLIGSVTLLEYLTGRNLLIDQLFWPDTAMTKLGNPGRMSPATASCIFCLGLSIFLLDRAIRVAQMFSTACLLIALLGLFGYVYGVDALYQVNAYSSMALHTAILLCMLAAGQLIARPRRCVHHLLTSNGPGGRMARRLIPATILVPLIVGWLRLHGLQAELFDIAFAAALFALANILIVATIVWYNATILDRHDSQRRHIEKDRDSLLEREQAARARAEKALLARDQLLAIVSHELRTPLTPVMLMTTALENRAQLPSDVQEDLHMIHEQIEIEARLIDNLLDLASLSQGKLELNRKPVNLHDSIRKVARQFEQRFHDGRVTFTTQLESSTPYVLGDPARIEQIIHNLFSNGMKFTPAGGQVKCRTFDQDDMFCLDVIDTGVGIDRETMHRIFEAFEQGDPSLTRRYSGLGIGLTISKLLAQLHGGHLHAHSGGTSLGATFSLCLPRATKPIEPATPVSLPNRAAALSILLVDDNDMTLRPLEMLLRSRGHRVQLARRGEEALDLVRNDNVVLLISDIGLPDISGWELMRQIREHSSIRGIAISGFVDEADRRKSLDSGYSHHLAKPIDMAQLLEAIDSVSNEMALSVS